MPKMHATRTFLVLVSSWQLASSSFVAEEAGSRRSNGSGEGSIVPPSYPGASTG